MAFDEGYSIGQKPEADVIESLLAKDINATEPRLTRYGYNAKNLAELLDTKPAGIRSFLYGKLAPGQGAGDLKRPFGDGCAALILFAPNPVRNRCTQAVLK